MIVPKLLRRRAFVLKRCSSKAQTGTSLLNQDLGLAQLIEDNGVIVVDQHELAGVTGSIPGARDDIDEIIRKKREGLDFDLLLLPNTDRFTRTGSLHGNSILWDLQGEGITVYFAAENLWSDDHYHQMLLSMMFDAARQTAIAISRGSTAGNTNSFLDGKSPHAKTPPYGMDRMYSADGKDLFILRNLPDGTQEMRDPTTDEVIRTFGRNPEKGSPVHYIKQKNEHIRLVPGNPLHVAVVTRIHQQIHVHGRSAHAVAKELTDAEVPSPTGVDWPAMTVRWIAFNPAYIGRLARGQTTMSVYHTSAPGAPIEAKHDPRELRDNPRPRRRKRPYEQWMERDDPALAEFLPEDVREPARTAIEADLLRRASSKPRSRDRHRQSTFILKDVLRSKQGGHRLTGRIAGRNNEVRYYQITKARNSPRTDHPLKPFVPADPLERAILGVLREVLQARPDIQGAVTRALDKRAAKQQDSTDRSSLERELRRRQRQVGSAIDSLTGDDAMDRPIQERLAGYRADVARLTTALRATPQPTAPIDIDAIADRVANELIDLADEITAEDVETVRQIIGLLVSRMEVDLTTKETEIVLQIPDWLAASLSRQPTMGLEAVLACKPFNETHQPQGAEISVYCCQQTASRPVCFECHRVRRAA